MRVAIDASFLHLPPSGTGSYVRHLIDALRNEDASLDLHLLRPPWLEDYPPSRRERLAWDLRGVQIAARHHRPDLVHIPHFSAPIFPLTAPLVVTVHDVIPLVLKQYQASRGMRVRLRIMTRTIKRARIVLTPSHHAAREIAERLQVPSARIRVTPGAASPCYRPLATAAERAAAHHLIERLGVHRPYIFNCGGHDIRKNLPVLIDAFARATPQLGEKVALVIAGAPHSGNPDVFPPLAPVIEHHGLHGRVNLTGFVTEEEKLALYQLSDLYVTPSVYEGFGLTALEAMACGVPTIAAHKTSLPEVVGNGGILVEPDAEPISETMVKVLTNGTVAQELRDRALARASTFSWHATARQTLAAYRDAMAQ